MPAKEKNAKADRIALERAQKDLNEQSVIMNEEVSKREHTELIEVLERSEWHLRFREGQIALMVDRQAYNDLLKKIDETTECHGLAIKELEEELALTQRAKAKLENELSEIRIDHKMMIKSLPRQMKELEKSMVCTIQKMVDCLEQEKDLESKTVLQGFHLQFGKNKQQYLDILYEARAQLGHFSEVLLESKSMHSNLPPRIRRCLEDRSKEELIFMFDALSFEDGVMEYFEKKFPKAQPQRWTSAQSPNLLLLQAERLGAGQAAARVSTP